MQCLGPVPPGSDFIAQVGLGTVLSVTLVHLVTAVYTW